jgi:hypothetical protein
MISPIEMIYWKPINTVRILRPLFESPKLPFNTSAGEKEVIYHAG